MMNILQQNIYNDIKELSNLDIQRQLWLNENNDTGQISSYVEVMNRLFDDNSFDTFVDKTAANIGFSPVLIYHLRALRDMLDSYVEKPSDREIIDDPCWRRIVEEAQMVIREWDNLPPSIASGTQ